ncbi:MULTISPECIES: ABC transporter substrate-binding protein [Metabacillus]|uniref:ABC transporter substrate-binding protein n=2 Tax=Metabacillus TaxID=2675233 RepID=A0A179SR68_9BACI|nr:MULTISPECIES: sugar ABC transporter substrate-binding protein [Metabacillus]OAS82782.1 ABC transporter substrate-binding protein [Metabacillus litoralis]QNF30224.1 sugar ABC transporter substrate-binding protein [Metabacillus sp. KUDC1714]
MGVRKSYLFLIFLLLTALTIVGCSSNKATDGTTTEGNDDTSKGDNTKVVTLDFWDMVWGPPEYIETAKKQVEKFNQEHPNIQVKYQSTPWSNWYQTFSTAIASGTAPDISTGAGYQAFQFYDQGAILPIDDVIEEWKAEGKLEDFFPGTVETMKYNDHYVALPWGLDLRVYYYRKDFFEEAGIEVPKNFDELRAAAKALTTDNGRYGMITPSDTGGTHYLFQLMLNNGGGIFTEDRKVDFMNERNVEALKLYSDMVKDGSVNPAGAGMVGDDAIKSFGQGDAAIILEGPGFKNRFPEMDEQIGVMPPLEGFQGDKGTVMWVNNLMIYKESKHPEEAKIFLKWWSENSLPLWKDGNLEQLSARISFSEDPFFQDNPVTKIVYDEYVPIGKTTGSNSTGAFPELNEIEGEGLMQNLTQRLIMGDDPKESMGIADQKIKEIMK